MKEGAEGIALDVHLSSDGIPVVIGDARLSRTTSAHGRVREKQASTLLQLDAGSWFNNRFPSRAKRQFARQSIPLLFEVLHWVREQKCIALVTINSSAPEVEAKVLREIDRAHVCHLTRVIAHNLQGLRRLRQLNPKINLGLRITGRPPAIEKAKALGAEVLLPSLPVVSQAFINRAHRASLMVIPWTVDNAHQMRRTLLEGVDGIITNYPARLTEIVGRLEKAVRTETAKRIARREIAKSQASPCPPAIDRGENSRPTQPAKRPSTIKEML